MGQCEIKEIYIDRENVMSDVRRNLGYMLVGTDDFPERIRLPGKGDRKMLTGIWLTVLSDLECGLKGEIVYIRNEESFAGIGIKEGSLDHASIEWLNLRIMDYLVASTCKCWLRLTGCGDVEAVEFYAGDLLKRLKGCFKKRNVIRRKVPPM